MMRRLALVALAFLVTAAGAGLRAADPPTASAPAILYTRDKPPATPQIADLPLQTTITQYGITWMFEQAARVGQFVTGDFYVVGPVRITGITPEPKDGRNGSCLNVSAVLEKCGFDSRIPHERYDAKLFLAPPIALQPGDALTSSISLADNEIGTINPMLWRVGKDQRSPVRACAVLTCLAQPVPPDAFRPSYAGHAPKIYLARDLRRSLLPQLARTPGTPKLAAWERIFQRPWIDLVMDEFGAPVDNMPVYGREYVRSVGAASLLLCLDFTPQEKERLLLSMVQVGIDLWGLAPAGMPGPWHALGGHGNGRKWPVLFAGVMLNDADMQAPEKKYPHLQFSEDVQTMFGPSWTGAKVVWAGHVGKDGNPKYEDWGAYEHLPPGQWKGDTGESYRRCCTSNAWVAEALAVRILHLEKTWNHDAFFAYVDRWMTEDDAPALKAIKEARGKDYSQDWAVQGSTWDPFVKELWLKYRNNLPANPDGGKTPPSSETWK